MPTSMQSSSAVDTMAMSTRYLLSVTHPRAATSRSPPLVKAKKLLGNDANLPSLNLLLAVCEPFSREKEKRDEYKMRL